MTVTDTHESLLTPSEAAQWLRSTERTLERWRHEQRGPAFVRLGRRIGYRRADLNAWVERQKCEPQQ
jgi:excisionase family DNA binding protein